ncbi:hypothetical protein I5403_12290 [Citrobacter farmeri]|uniref:hypothetical protein n=1 Tax=Citrobacter farmeri TaxID=67824 RepID=UPI001921A827|nr:hypothetical protein [Citrobacter farmeri]MBJ8746094.1 hypothetical protein [Citrobacter farmeri]MBJ8759345.1 hypothetical protein [Citrobacter farmeri]
MTLEEELTIAAGKVRPEAHVWFDRSGPDLIMFWRWTYKNKDLEYSRAEKLQDYNADYELVGAVVDFCVIQMGLMEKEIDDTTLS